MFVVYSFSDAPDGFRLEKSDHYIQGDVDTSPYPTLGKLQGICRLSPPSLLCALANLPSSHEYD